MYKILKSTGEQIFTESLIFVNRHKDGHLVQCNEPQATGISYRSNEYNLFGTEGINAQDTVSVITTDSGTTIQSSDQACCDHDDIVAELLERITNLELQIGG